MQITEKKSLIEDIKNLMVSRPHSYPVQTRYDSLIKIS